LDLSRYFGTDAKFQGSLTVIDYGGSWQLQLRDVIVSEVDLDLLVRPLPYYITGLATIHCAQAYVDTEELQANVEIQAGPGIVGKPLLRSLAQSLHCLMDERLQNSETPRIRYDQLSASLEITQSSEVDSLTLRGTCLGDQKGILIADQQGALVTEPLSQPRPIDLLTAFLPQSEDQLPAVRESIPFLRLIRLPSSVASGTGSKQPHAKVQFVSAEEDEPR